MPPKSTTLWVGKIAPSVEPETIKSLLEACGAVREWKPAIDPKGGGMKGFGFCTYGEAEGVIVALAVLDTLEVDGMELSLKGKTATNEYIDWYKKSIDSGDVSSSGASIAVLEAEARQQVEAILAPRPKTNMSAQDAAEEFMSQLQEETNELLGPSKPIDSKGSESLAAKRHSPSMNDLSAGAEKLLDTEHKSKRSRHNDAENLKVKIHPAWQRWNNFLRRKDEENKSLAKDFRRRVLRHEKDIEQELKNEIARDRDRRLERQRDIISDNFVSDSDDEEEPWARKFYHNSKKASDRRRRREREEREDEEDKKREEKEAMERVHAEKESAKVEDSKGEPCKTTKGLSGTKEIVRSEPKKVLEAFAEEDEPHGKHLGPIPIRYTEEEMKGYSSKDQVPKTLSSKDSSYSKAEVTIDAKKKAMALVPSDQESVFNYSIKWRLLDEATKIQETIFGWIKKKIQDLIVPVGEELGDEELSYCEYIMSMVKKHETADSVLQNVRDVLDEDAQDFVTKLYKVLIFESEKINFGG